MGGDCLNYGCVPSKALIRTARLAHQMRHGARYGLAVGLRTRVQLPSGDAAHPRA
jgi:pyruvate/2-oxoglutarate dehydrogenase complex dihydrolipoamide dehydrogenase (E3) component